MARPSSKAREEDRTILCVDEAGSYLLPFVTRTYAPRIGEFRMSRTDLSSGQQGYVLTGVLFDEHRISGYLKSVAWPRARRALLCL